jgi:diacylglycerol kinase (ATP)
MRIIFLLGILAFLLGIIYQLRGIQLMILFITITIVFLAEIFNTAIELILNMAKEEYHPKIKLIKDISAAVVFLSCLNAIAIGYIIFGRRIVNTLFK